LPLSLAPLGEKATVIKSVENAKSYEYYNRNFPFLKSINSIPIDKIIDSLVYKSKKAPKEAKFDIGLSEIQKLGKLYFINNLKLLEHLQLFLPMVKQTLPLLRFSCKTDSFAIFLSWNLNPP